VGPYVQAIRAGDFLFVSGQLPLDPLTNSPVRAGVGAQTRRVLENVKAILEGAGATLAHIVRTTVYLKNLDDFTQVNTVYAEYFPEHKPARSTVEVGRLPKDAVVAMDAIAYLGA
jgi:2-iminobutanoate/2-iminopropanoate deaminase